MKIHSLDKQENLLKAERHIMMLLIKRESQFFLLLLLLFFFWNCECSLHAKRDDIYLTLLGSMSCWWWCFRSGFFHRCSCILCRDHIFLGIRWLATLIHIVADAIVVIAVVVVGGADICVTKTVVVRCDWHSCNSNRTIVLYRTFTCHTTDYFMN